MPRFDNRTIQRIRVPLGFLFAAIFLVFAEPTVLTIAVGSGVALIGVLFRAWASGHIRKAMELAVSGPYANTRNPLYLGSLVMGIGFTVATGVWWLAILFFILFVGIYLPVMSVETEDMRQIFGDEYEDYKSNTPILFPRLTPWKRSSTRFDFQLYLQYREYRSALGAIAAIGVLAVKAYLFG